jgi:hypothetical protein
MLKHLFVAFALIAGCGSTRGSGFTPTDTAGGSVGGDTDGGTFGGGDAEAGTPEIVGHLKGKVLAPEGTIPISGALVYLTATPPETIPAGAYCDKCVQLAPNVPYTYSKPDGTFDLPAYATGAQQLVVQKGQFRRVRPFDVKAGDQQVDAALSTFPAKTDASKGDSIPRMAIVTAQWDHVELSLAKLGLGKIKPGGIFGDTVTDASFDMKDESLLEDATAMAAYHIVFIPCSFSSGTSCNSSQPAGTTKVKENLKQYVASGGKLYATDYAYEFVRQPWPGFISWEGETATLGSACKEDAYDAPAVNMDPGLGAWLSAIGESNVSLKESWTAIRSVTPQPGTDPEGKPVTITPKVWASSQRQGATTPATVSFENGCGRVLFSTYHTEGAGSAQLLAQEKALLYVLLEVGVCVGKLPPPR